MKKIILSFLFTTALSFFSNAQKCGTMDLLDSLYVKHPELKAKHDSLERATQNRIHQKYPWTQPPQGTFPAIPGFIETGNREEDIKNYGLAKEALLKKDPAEYYRLTRKTTGQKR